MGARKARLAYAKQHGGPVPPAARPVKLRMFDAVGIDKLVFDTEYAAIQKDNPQIGPVTFVEAVLESGLERLRQAREARQEQERTKDNLNVPATHLPPGIAAAAARLEAIKRGAA